MKTWTLPAAALFCALILLPGFGQGQAPSVTLTSGDSTGEIEGLPGSDGSLVIGSLSVTRGGESVPIFESISVSRFDYQSTCSAMDSDSMLGASATMTKFESSSPVIRIRSAVSNDVRFDLATEAGAITGQRWVMAGEMNATADIFLLGTGSFEKSADIVTAGMSPGDDLYLRVRRPGEPFELTTGVATGRVSGEAHVSLEGTTAKASFVPYENVTVTPVRASESGASFSVFGSDGAKVVALSVEGMEAGMTVSVDGKRVGLVSSVDDLFGSEPLCWLYESQGTVVAMVYLPHMSIHSIELGVEGAAILSEEAFTIASALAALGGLVMVATATVWLFRK